MWINRQSLDFKDRVRMATEWDKKAGFTVIIYSTYMGNQQDSAWLTYVLRTGYVFKPDNRLNK